MAEKTPKPNPNQLILDVLRAIDCKMDNLILAVQGMPVTEPTPVVVKPPVATGISWGRKTVHSTATLLLSANDKRLGLSIVNGDVVSIFLGDDETVTDEDGSNPGYELLPNAEFNTQSYQGRLFAIVTAGTAEVTYWEEVE